MKQFSTPIRIGITTPESPPNTLWFPDGRDHYVTPLLSNPSLLPPSLPDNDLISVGIKTNDTDRVYDAFHFFIRNEDSMFMLGHEGHGTPPAEKLSEADKLALHNMEQPSAASWLRYRDGYLTINLLDPASYPEDFLGWSQFLLHAFENAPHMVRKVKPRPSKSTPELALHNALQHIGCYGKISNDPARAVFVRRWVSDRFRHTQGYSYRYRMNQQATKKQAERLARLHPQLAAPPTADATPAPAESTG